MGSTSGKRWVDDFGVLGRRLRDTGEGSSVEDSGWRVSRAVKVNVKKTLS